MDIRTRFNINDTVYFMHSNKINFGVVNKINIEIISANDHAVEDVFQYTITTESTYYEYELFSSKQDLLNSL